MPSGSTPYTWDEAFAEFLTWYAAHRAAKTVRFYHVHLRRLVRWARENGASLEAFGKRHMDRYLAERQRTVSRTTLHHDGVAATAFFKWRVR